MIPKKSWIKDRNWWAILLGFIILYYVPLVIITASYALTHGGIDAHGRTSATSTFLWLWFFPVGLVTVMLLCMAGLYSLYKGIKGEEL